MKLGEGGIFSSPTDPCTLLSRKAIVKRAQHSLDALKQKINMWRNSSDDQLLGVQWIKLFPRKTFLTPDDTCLWKLGHRWNCVMSQTASSKRRTRNELTIKGNVPNVTTKPKGNIRVVDVAKEGFLSHWMQLATVSWGYMVLGWDCYARHDHGPFISIRALDIWVLVPKNLTCSSGQPVGATYVRSTATFVKFYLKGVR